MALDTNQKIGVEVNPRNPSYVHVSLSDFRAKSQHKNR